MPGATPPGRHGGVHRRAIDCRALKLVPNTMGSTPTLADPAAGQEGKAATEAPHGSKLRRLHWLALPLPAPTEATVPGQARPAGDRAASYSCCDAQQPGGRGEDTCNREACCEERARVAGPQ